MPRPIRFVLAAMVLCTILLGLAGFRQVSMIRFAAGGWVVQIPFGSGIQQARRVIGIDGRPYGPLTFAAEGAQLVVADTYHQQLFDVRDGHMQTRALDGAMIEDVGINSAGQVVLADNKSLALWLLDNQGEKKIVAIAHEKGYTEAIWQVSFTPNNRVLVEWIQFGRGSLATRLQEYALDGQLVRTFGESQVSHDNLRAGVRGPGSALIRAFQVAPDGSLYVEPQETSSNDPVIRIYRQNGLSTGRVVIRTPEPTRTTDFLGVDRRGWIYVAVDINMPHKARVLVVNGKGQLVADIPVAAVPVYAANYGRVLPSGKILLVQSTASSYRIRAYRPVRYRVWRWKGF